MVRLEKHLILLIFVIVIKYIGAEKACTINDLNKIASNECGENESCMQSNKSTTTGVCQCKGDYSRTSANEPCVRIAIPTKSPTSDTSVGIVLINEQSTGNTGAIVGTLLVILVITGCVVGAYYGEKRYRFVTRVRNRFVRRQDVSTYDEVMIGREDDDDPPLA